MALISYRTPIQISRDPITREIASMPDLPNTTPVAPRKQTQNTTRNDDSHRDEGQVLNQNRAAAAIQSRSHTDNDRNGPGAGSSRQGKRNERAPGERRGTGRSLLL